MHLKGITLSAPPLFPSPCHSVEKFPEEADFSEDKVTLSCGSEETVPTFVLSGFTGLALPQLLCNGHLPLLFSHVLFGLAQKMNGHFLRHKVESSASAFSGGLVGNHRLSVSEDLLSVMFENHLRHHLFKLCQF